MHDLAAPQHLAGIGLERRHRGSERKLFLAIAAVEIRAGRTDGEIKNAVLSVERHAGPNIRRAGLMDDFVRQGVEYPFQLAGLRVDREHGARGIHRVAPVPAGPTDKERVLVHGRRLQQRERPLVVGRIPLVNVENPAIGEALAFLAAVRIDGVQFGIHGADVDDLLAWRAWLRRRRLPIGDATRFQIRLGQSLENRVRVIGPLDVARIGRKREHTIERRRDIDRIVDEQRRRRPVRKRRLPAAVGDVAGVNFPDFLQLADILRVDLIGRGIFLVLQIAIEGVPAVVMRCADDLLGWSGWRAWRRLLGGILRRCGARRDKQAPARTDQTANGGGFHPAPF